MWVYSSAWSREDTLCGLLKLKLIARLHIQTEDLESAPSTCKLDINSKAPMHLERNGLRQLQTKVCIPDERKVKGEGKKKSK